MSAGGINLTLSKTVADIWKMDKLMSQKEAQRAQILDRWKEDKIANRKQRGE